MSTQLKRKIVFSLLMGLVTTGIVSFSLIALNLGFSDKFAFREVAGDRPRAESVCRLDTKVWSIPSFNGLVRRRLVISRGATMSR